MVVQYDSDSIECELDSPELDNPEPLKYRCMKCCWVITAPILIIIGILLVVLMVAYFTTTLILVVVRDSHSLFWLCAVPTITISMTIILIFMIVLRMCVCIHATIRKGLHRIDEMRREEHAIHTISDPIPNSIDV